MVPDERQTGLLCVGVHVKKHRPQACLSLPRKVVRKCSTNYPKTHMNRVAMLAWRCGVPNNCKHTRLPQSKHSILLLLSSFQLCHAYKPQQITWPPMVCMSHQPFRLAFASLVSIFAVDHATFFFKHALQGPRKLGGQAGPHMHHRARESMVAPTIMVWTCLMCPYICCCKKKSIVHITIAILRASIHHSKFE